MESARRLSLVIAMVLAAAASYAGDRGWRRYPGNPVFGNHPTDPHLSFVGDPGVLYLPDTGEFYMWYASLLQFHVPEAAPYGRPCSMDQLLTCALPIALATSRDGVTWTRFTNGTPQLDDDYVLLRDSETSWDSWSLETPTVVFDGRFRMWYSGQAFAPTASDRTLTMQVGYAESPDAIHWRKYDDPTTTDPARASSDPVLGPRRDGWDDLFVGDPSVLKDGDTYKMWYGGGSSRIAGGTVAIGYASSGDGIHWTRLDAPVLTASPAEGLLNGVQVLKVRGRYEMWYYAGALPGIFAATSADGVRWKRRGRVMGLGRRGRWDDAETSSPAVVLVGDRYWLYFTGSNCPLEDTRRRGDCEPTISIGLARKRR